MSTRAREMIEDDTIVQFKEKHTENLDFPHNDALVIEIMLTDYEKNMSLVDTGRSVNMI